MSSNILHLRVSGTTLWAVVLLSPVGINQNDSSFKEIEFRISITSKFQPKMRQRW